MTSQQTAVPQPPSKEAIVAVLKKGLSAEFAAADLGRIFGMLDIWSGQREAITLPLQHVRAGWHMPDLPTSPWLDPDRFPFMNALRALYPALRAELLATIDTVTLHQYGTDGGKRPQIAAHPQGWREAILFSSLADRGEGERWRFPCASTVIPMVLQHHKLIGELGFLALDAGTVISQHTDPWNFMVNIHLPLVAPEGCGIRVGTESRPLREGEVLAFDTSFLHEAWNKGARRRITFYIRTLHPALTGAEREALVSLAAKVAALEIEFDGG